MKRLALLVCLAIACGSIPSPAGACTCWRPKAEEILTAASLIFYGTVLSVEPTSPQSLGGAGTGSVTIRGPQSGMRAKFKVQHSYKGPIRDEVDVAYTASDGANCGWRFSVGDKATVFAAGNNRSGFVTGMCLMIPSTAYNYTAALEEYRATRTAFAARLQQNPGDGQALREQADFFVKYRDHDDAEATFSQLLALLPGDVAALVGRGQTRFALARFEEALIDYRAALAIDVRDADARRGQTLSLVRLGRLEERDPGDRDFSGLKSGYGHRISFAGSDLAGASFRNAELNRVDFANADLRSADFSGAAMHTCNFAGARLAGAKFENLKQAYNTNFSGAGLESTSFAGAYLFHVNLAGAVLDNANFTKARLESASLENASIVSADFRGASLLLARLRGTTWDGHDLSGVDLRGGDLRNTVFRRVNLRGAVFGHSPGLSEIMDLRGADLSDADLAGVGWGPALVDCRTKLPPHFDLADLPVVPLWGDCAGDPPRVAPQKAYGRQQGPRLNKIRAPNAKLSQVSLSGFGFWQVQFDGADFSRATLTHIDIQGGSYVGANFARARLDKAYLHKVDFKDATFEEADLSGARISEVDFGTARLKGVVLNDACFDSKTTWPSGFDPIAAGAKACRP